MCAPTSKARNENSRSCCSSGRNSAHKDAEHLKTFLQRESKRVARNPCTYLWVCMILTIALSAVGLKVGEFDIEVENEGWWSRGTLQSGRQRQANLVNNQRFNLAYNDSAWDIWMDADRDHASYETLLYSAPTMPTAMSEEETNGNNNNDNDSEPEFRSLLQQTLEKDLHRRNLQENTPESVLKGCDLSFYTDLSGANLWPIWKMPDKEYESTENRSVFDADALEAICIAEGNTQFYLEENGLCENEARRCVSGKCLPPYSIVLIARLVVPGGLDAAPDGSYAMDCKALSEAWKTDLEFVQTYLMEDIKQLKILLTPGNGNNTGEEKTQPEFAYGYYPALVQGDFDTNGGRTQYSSSIFDTSSATEGEELYEVVDNFDRASDINNGIVTGAYDTGFETFADIKTDSLIGSDMTLALASAAVISVAILWHTQSLLLTGLGLLQIILSFPMSFFVYKLILGFDYFPFLNFIGVFVVFALGAGDIYVAFDKWTNYRKNNATKSTEYVAAYALPESLSAMFLTTITTSLAFFATAVCPVAPIKMFAIFCGLLILLDYLLVVLFIFPGLCIYDLALIKRAKRNSSGGVLSGCWIGCVSCGACVSCCHKTAAYDDVVVLPSSEGCDEGMANEKDSDDTIRYNSTQRFLLTFSEQLYRARWPLLVLCVVSFGLCSFYATKLALPDSSDVRLLKPGIQYEQNYQWRKEILSSDLNDLSGSRNSIVWGLNAADTGKQSDPYDGTSLVLDETFDPSSAEAQIYLRDFCSNIFIEDFAMLSKEDFVCPINKFDDWLKENAKSDEPDPLYSGACGSPNQIPVDSDKFHSCLSSWALLNQNFDIISRDGVVKYMRIPFRNPAVFTDPYDVLQEQKEAIDEWMTASNEDAPEGVNNAFFTGLTFHWHDTNGSIQRSAYSGAGISLAASAGIVLLSSRSVILTVFTTATIFYILVSVTTLLIVFGWTLGFLESVCFSILVGVSVDFVIHFTHAYVHAHKGELSRKERTKFALVTMGPSVLATAATTFFSAIVMLFTTITFFRKFALVLFLTVIMATIAAFVVFITLTNCFGPTNPTYLVDKCLSLCPRKQETEE